MRWRITRPRLTATIAALVLAIPAPIGAQTTPDSPEPVRTFGPSPIDPGGPDMGGFVGLFVLLALISVGVSIWKFAALRDMGIRRGLSRSDATTAALFPDDSVTSTMILKPEVNDRRRGLRRRASRRPAAEPTIEERLAKVDSLRTRGLITAEEAASRRDEILDEI